MKPVSLHPAAPDRVSANPPSTHPLAARLHLWSLGGVVLLAGGLRLYALARESLWLDEATTVVVARQSLSHILSQTAADVHPPLYYLLMHLWLRLGDGEAALRAFSVLVGLLTVPLLYGLTRDLFDRRVGLLAALLLALSPLHIAYSQEARMYVLAALIVCGASWVLARIAAQREVTRGWFLGYALLLALAFYTHYITLFTPLFHAIYVGHVAVRRRLSRRQIVGWLAGLAGAVVLFLPWLPTFFRQTFQGGGGWIALVAGKPTLASLADTAMEFTVGLAGTTPLWLGQVGLVLGLGVTLMALASQPQRLPSTTPSPLVFALLYAWGTLAMVWLVSQVRPVFLTRYLLVFLPGFLLLLARGLDALPRDWLRISVLAALLLLNLFSLRHVYNDSQKPDWRAAAAYIQSVQEASEAAIFVLPGWDAKALAYYADGQRRIVPGPVVEEGEEALAAAVADALSSATGDGNALWVVWARPYPTRPQVERALEVAGFEIATEHPFYGIEGITLYVAGSGGNG